MEKESGSNTIKGVKMSGTVQNENNNHGIDTRCGGVKENDGSNVHCKHLMQSGAMSSTPYVIENFSLCVKEGQTIALVGESGCGKSTLIKLLFRLYDVNCGSVKINNLDITEVTQKSLRKFIGIVPQDTVLFNSTILFNLTYGSYYITKFEDLKDRQNLIDLIIDSCKKAQI